MGICSMDSMRRLRSAWTQPDSAYRVSFPGTPGDCVPADFRGLLAKRGLAKPVLARTQKNCRILR